MIPILVFGCLLFFVIPNQGIHAESTAITTSVKGFGTGIFQTELSKAKELIKKGKLKEAAEIYKTLYAQSNLSSKQKQKIKKLKEALNIANLFSKESTSHSFIYEVVEGDSLHKIAKKHNTTIELIKRSNTLTKDIIYPKMKLKIIRGTFSVHIDKSENILTLLLNEKSLRHYAVSTGENNKTHIGEFKIINKLENPTWYKAGVAVPPDSSKNILGPRWLGFNDPGYGIHGTTHPESIGQQASSGCVRMLNEEVKELYDLLPLGTKVTIVD